MENTILKTKVLQYAVNGNDLINKYRELIQTPYNENIWYSENQHNTASYKVYDIIFQFGNVFIEVDRTSIENILSMGERIDSFYQTFIESRKELKWTPSIFIELYKRLGLDYSVLEQNRNKSIQERKEKEEREKAERAELAKKQAEKHMERLLNEAKKFIQGEKIDKNDFMELCEKNGINLHIRTKGLLNRINTAEIGFSEVRIYCNKARQVNLDKVFEAAKELKEVLTK